MNWAGLVPVCTQTFGTSLNESSLRAAMRDKAKAEERWQSAPPYLLVAMFALGASPA